MIEIQMQALGEEQRLLTELMAGARREAGGEGNRRTLLSNGLSSHTTLHSHNSLHSYTSSGRSDDGALTSSSAFSCRGGRSGHGKIPAKSARPCFVAELSGKPDCARVQAFLPRFVFQTNPTSSSFEVRSGKSFPLL